MIIAAHQIRDYNQYRGGERRPHVVTARPSRLYAPASANSLDLRESPPIPPGTPCDIWYSDAVPRVGRAKRDRKVSERPLPAEEAVALAAKLNAILARDRERAARAGNPVQAGPEPFYHVRPAKGHRRAATAAIAATDFKPKTNDGVTNSGFYVAIDDDKTLVGPYPSRAAARLAHPDAVEKGSYNQGGTGQHCRCAVLAALQKHGPMSIALLARSTGYPEKVLRAVTIPSMSGPAGTVASCPSGWRITDAGLEYLEKYAGTAGRRPPRVVGASAARSLKKGGYAVRGA